MVLYPYIYLISSCALFASMHSSMSVLSHFADLNHRHNGCFAFNIICMYVTYARQIFVEYMPTVERLFSPYPHIITYWHKICVHDMVNSLNGTRMADFNKFKANKFADLRYWGKINWHHVVKSSS